MDTEARRRATEILAGLSRSGEGEEASPEALIPLIYQELHGMARRYMGRERVDHTLQPTALVHEAYLRLIDSSNLNWQDRNHFFAIAARVMRRLLIDHARKRTRRKRGGGLQRVTLADWRTPTREDELDPAELLSLDAALERLAEVDPRAAEVVELRFYAGLTVSEVARHLELSKRTVEGDWTHARAWLQLALTEES